MTYSQMTKNIENIKKQIDFMYELQKEQTEPNKAYLIGDIVNNLSAYKNYLIYAKEYKEDDKTMLSVK